MKKSLILVTAAVLLVMLASGCASEETQAPTPAGEPTSTFTLTGEEANFRLLLSDDASEVTAINEFASVNVTVNKIGFQRGGESGSWIEPEDFESWTGNLLDLRGTDAVVIWEGYIEPGNYTKAFIYVDNVTGTLIPEVGGGQVDDIRIPSDKLQITKPFTVTEDGAEFVFDITVIKAGRSGMYLVKPQVGESGPDQEYTEVNHEDRDDSTREMKFKGTILTIDSDNWTVSIGDEVRTVNVAEAKIEGIPAEGRLAKIEGIVGKNDIIIASKVEIKEPKEIKESKYEGTIVTFTSDNWTVRIGNQVRTVNVEAAKIEGTPDEGLRVKIEGTEGESNTIIASEVEVKEAEEDEFEGTIVSISDNWTMEIKGEMWVVDVSEADIEGDPVEELEAEIKGTVVADKTIKASEVEIKEPGE